jgi:hypothetical protein
MAIRSHGRGLGRCGQQASGCRGSGPRFSPRHRDVSISFDDSKRCPGQCFGRYITIKLGNWCIILFQDLASAASGTNERFPSDGQALQTSLRCAKNLVDMMTHSETIVNGKSSQPFFRESHEQQRKVRFRHNRVKSFQTPGRWMVLAHT